MAQKSRQARAKQADAEAIVVVAPRRSARLAAKNARAPLATTQLSSLDDAKSAGRAKSASANGPRRRAPPRPRPQTTRRQHGTRPNRRRLVYGDVETLPDEILWMVLGDFLEAPWHAVVAQVSRRWRAVLVAWAAHTPRGPSRRPLVLCKSLMTYAISTDARLLAAWLRDVCGCPMGAWAFDAAARSFVMGYEWWVEWLRAAEPPCPWTKTAIADSITHTRGCALAAWMRDQAEPCPWHEGACEAAVSADAFEIHRKENAARRAPRARSRAKRVASVDEANNNNNDNNGDSVERVLLVPTRLGWLRAQKPPCPWSARVCYFAAMYADAGGMAVLRWLRAQDPPCPWDTWTLNELARSGTIADFIWAFDAGAPLGANAVASAVSMGRTNVLEAILERCGDAQSLGGRHVWLPTVSARAGEAPDPQSIIAWLRNVAHCPFDEGFTAALARNDQVDMLQWARADGMPLDAVRACQGAASYGATRVLTWFRDGGHFDAKSLFAAAARRSIEYDDTGALDCLVSFMPTLDVRRLSVGCHYMGRKMRERLAALNHAPR
ncbi:F-box incomplete domain containing protein [Pandoravirus neocaledonia]|uniref:F-box incomplete domain containing protein n=1 Tax=Pandoravirus neocaledonia TaxID=2107708 RepID=A0A2U7UBI6_9VIRU|nr:F-box incomplete domain containing protein [Pandoravirus neocaledonia]AVK75752.1 F-box incomplete domain containing protein [Pandoravirus neocaledonia]